MTSFYPISIKSIDLIIFALSLFVVTHQTKIPSSVIELDERFLEMMNEGFWLIEFYIPWCAHCKKLHPTWEQVAHTLTDANSKVRVGRIDCTVYTTVSSQLNIRGYPTIIFFRNGLKISYEGERKRENIVNFVEKSAGPVINKLDSLDQLIRINRTSDVEPFFVFAHNKFPNHDLYNDFKNISELLFSELRFFESHSQLLPFQTKMESDSLFVIRDGNQEEFHPSKGSLIEWVGTTRWPAIQRVTGSNLHLIAETSRKKLVLVVVDSIDRLNSSTDSGGLFKTVKEAAFEASKETELKKNFQFGWMIDSSLANSIVMGDLGVPNIFVFNYSSYEYYWLNESPMNLTIASLLVFLEEIIQESIPPRGGRAWITRLRRMFYDISTNVYDMFYHQPILTTCLFGVPLAFLSIIIYTICSSEFSVDREEIYPEQSDEDSFVDDSDHEKAE